MEFFLYPSQLVYVGRKGVEFGHDEEERNETRLGQDENKGHSYCFRGSRVIKALVLLLATET